jgi:predicted PurR-regulated permease PerM
VPGVNEEELRKVIVGDLSAVDSGVNMVRRALGTIFDLVGQVIVVLVYLAFLVAEQTSLAPRIRRSYPTDQAQQIFEIMERINTSISNYIAVKTFVSVLTGVFTTVVLLLFGVDYAVLWGVLAFLFNYIPYVGSIVAILLPSALALVQFGSLGWAVVILFVLNLVQSVIGYWLEPVLTGRRLDLSPLVIILALAFWGSIWGVVGMILAVPLIVSIKIILENIPATRPLGAILSHEQAAAAQVQPPATEAAPP